MSQSVALTLVRQSRRSARSAGLRYVSETTTGIQRVRKGKSFAYLDRRGKPLKNAAHLDRIRRLAIPPAWENVWICTAANGHIQATGTDARGRKQYRYHAKWQSARDKSKYDKLVALAESLPKIRSRVQRDLARKELCREKVLAAVVRVMERTAIRVGNDEYASTNGSYGVTTLKNKHARVNGQRVRFDFRGKSGIQHALEVKDNRLAKIVKQCQELPGQELFEYIVDDEGRTRDIGSADVNRYLREIAGHRFSAKDLRTWTGTVAAAWALAKFEPPQSKTEGRRSVNAAIDEVATLLGNTRAVCRKCYIHPAVIDAFLDGTLAQRLARGKTAKSALPRHEAAVMGLLT